jgi:hypothetical protein
VAEPVEHVDEHLLARVEGPPDMVGVQRGGQAHIDQIDVGVVVDRVDVGAGGEPELGADRSELGRRATDHHDRFDVGVDVVDLGVGHSRNPSPTRRSASPTVSLGTPTRQAAESEAIEIAARVLIASAREASERHRL